MTGIGVTVAFLIWDQAAEGSTPSYQTLSRRVANRLDKTASIVDRTNRLRRPGPKPVKLRKAEDSDPIAPVAI